VGKTKEESSRGRGWMRWGGTGGASQIFFRACRNLQEIWGVRDVRGTVLLGWPWLVKIQGQKHGVSRPFHAPMRWKGKERRTTFSYTGPSRVTSKCRSKKNLWKAYVPKWPDAPQNKSPSEWAQSVKVAWSCIERWCYSLPRGHSTINDANVRCTRWCVSLHFTADMSRRGTAFCGVWLHFSTKKWADEEIPIPQLGPKSKEPAHSPQAPKFCDDRWDELRRPAFLRPITTNGPHQSLKTVVARAKLQATSQLHAHC
jgi:hypothetical protein